MPRQAMAETSETVWKAICAEPFFPPLNPAELTQDRLPAGETCQAGLLFLSRTILGNGFGGHLPQIAVSGFSWFVTTTRTVRSCEFGESGCTWRQGFRC